MRGFTSDVVNGLESFALTLSCDERSIESGRRSNALGSPLAAAAHLVSVLANQPDYQPVQAGEIVAIGTITTARSIQVGKRWRSELQGVALPGLTVDFVA